jgi:thymidylate kinase
MTSSKPPRLVMLTGTSPGSGKSSAMRALAECYRNLGRDVMTIDEDAVWGERRLDQAPVDHTTASPLFYDLLHRERPTGVGLAPVDVVPVFEHLVQEARDRGAVWLQDWSWPDLLDQLGWDHATVRQTSQSLQQIGAAVTPRVLYLRVDPAVALRRAVDERGAVWFRRHAGAPLAEPVTAATVEQVAARSRAAEPARIDALAAWTTTYLDAAATQNDVLEAAWRALEPAAGAAPGSWTAS